MSEKINVVMSVNDLLAAGKTLGSDLSPISLFWNEGEGALPASLMRNGALREDLLPAFQTIAQARRMSSCVYICANGLLDSNFYFPSDGLPGVSLSMADDGIRLQSPAAVEGTMIWLAEQAGESLVRGCDFEGELPVAEAHVLFGLVDAVRRKTMSGMGRGDRDDLNKVRMDELKQAMAAREENGEDVLQWLAPHFAEGLEIGKFDEDALGRSLHSLVQQGYGKLDGEEIGLGEAMTDLALQFLLVEGHLRLRSVEVEADGQVRTSEVRGLRGRGNAILLWSDDGKKVHLMGTSPAQVLAIVNDFITLPGGEKVEEAPLAARAAGEGSEIPQQKQTSIEENEAQKSKKLRKRRPWLVIILIVAGLLIAAFLLLMLYAYSQDRFVKIGGINREIFI